MNDFHTSVFLKEAIDFLNVKKEKKYIDATLGGGGHSFEIANHGGVVLGIDQDQEAIDYVREKTKDQRSKIKTWERLTLVKDNFRDIEKIAKINGFEKVNGIIFDLGISSHQLDHRERGFSFEGDSMLDMRMDKNLKIKASDLINGLTRKELYKLFTRLGEERNAFFISEHIVKYRKIIPIQTSAQLISIIQDAYKIPGENISSFTKASIAKRVFQALRIAVNDELNNLRESLPQALSLLADRGRMVVISFHSLEDRIVKHCFEDFEKQKLGVIITKKPISPGFSEIRLNTRSRSAKLRVFERIL